MKILCLADFHISTWIDAFNVIEKIENIPRDYQIVAIAGDLFEPCFLQRNDPYKVLEKCFSNIPAVFCLGNHEFVGSKYESVLDCFKNSLANIHCLDIEGKAEIGEYNFVGNTLWYDDSMSVYATRCNYEFDTVKLSSDYLFNPREKFDDCISQIKANYNVSKRNILVTHTCPHYLLNGYRHSGEGANAYSGTIDLLDKIKFDYAICGHTHFQVKADIKGCNAINVGSSKNEFRYYFLSIS